MERNHTRAPSSAWDPLYRAIGPHGFGQPKLPRWPNYRIGVWGGVHATRIALSKESISTALSQEWNEA